MPYRWTEHTDSERAELQLWPYNALPRAGLAAMILGFFLCASIPLIGFVGTRAFWGLLPFMLAAVWALDYALRRNRKDRQVVERLTLNQDRLHLSRSEPGKPPQTWDANPYWTRVSLHKEGGPVPNYVTLTGNGREVEIGAFLSEEERTELYDDLTLHLARLNHGQG